MLVSWFEPTLIVNPKFELLTKLVMRCSSLTVCYFLLNISFKVTSKSGERLSRFLFGRSLLFKSLELSVCKRVAICFFFKMVVIYWKIGSDVYMIYKVIGSIKTVRPHSPHRPSWIYLPYAQCNRITLNVNT